MPKSQETTVVTMSADDVKDLVQRYYRLTPMSATGSDGEAASVTRIVSSEGVWAAKIFTAEPGVSDVVRWQGELSERAREFGLPVARLLPARDGSLTVSARLRTQPLVIQLTEWLGWKPVAAFRPGASLLYDIGRTAARFSQAFAGAPLPPHDVGHIWELSRTVESLGHALSKIPTGRPRDTLKIARQRFVREVVDLLPELPRGIVHHDLHDENLLSDGEQVTGILDFGDAVYGARVAELIVAGAYAARRSNDPGAALLHVVRGWSSVTSLDESERRVILPGAIARLATNAATWAIRSEGQRGDYARSRAEGSLTTIEALMPYDTNEFVRGIRILGAS